MTAGQKLVLVCGHHLYKELRTLASILGPQNVRVQCSQGCGWVRVREIYDGQTGLEYGSETTQEFLGSTHQGLQGQAS